MWLYFPVKNLYHSEGNWLYDQTSSQKSIPFWGELTLWLYFPVKNLSHSEGTWLCDLNFQPKIYPILRGPDYVIIISSQTSIPFWGDLTLWLYSPAKILSHSEGTDYVIILSSQKSIPFGGELTMWLYFPAKNLSPSEETWLCDHNFQSKIYPFLGELTMWLWFQAKNLSHSEGTWLCDYTFQSKSYNLSHSEETWLCDYTFQSKIYIILRGTDYMIITSSQKSVPFWGELTIWLYSPVKNLSHSEGTWLCDYTFQSKTYPTLRGPDYVIILSSQNLSHSDGNWLCDYTFQQKIYAILRRPDYVIILSSQKSIPFWGNLTIWLYFPVKNLYHSEGTWLCDHNFQPKIYPILRGTDSVIILSSQKSIPFWDDLTMWS